MKLLVTGGAGFIGSHIVEHALASGHEVAVLDNFSTGARENVPAGVRVFEVDLRDRSRVLGALGAFGPTHVSHHAAWVDAPASLLNPREHFENNVMGSIHLMQACAAVNVERIVFASSGGAIYGETQTLATERALPKPENPYGAGKLAVEHLLAAQQHVGGPSSMSLRYPNVYGPRQRSGVIGVFSRAALRGEELVVFGENEGGLRTYAFVDDVASFNLQALTVAFGRPMVNMMGFIASTHFLAKSIVAMSGSRSPIVNRPARVGDIRSSQISGEFGWARGSRTPIDDGLQKTLEWWRTQ